MAGSITTMGTTYNLPNYTGVLFQLTPSDTPLFSAIGGLGGGMQADSTQYEWETFDLRSAGQNVVLEGADAPTPQERVRANVTNVCQIQQEAVTVSYTKLAAYGQKSGLNNNATNPVTQELDWQLEQRLKEMVRDINFSFIQGTYQLPTDNTTARKTRGLLSAITSNVQSAAADQGQGTTITAASDTFTTSAAHGLAVGDNVSFPTITTTTGISANTTYYVNSVPSSTTFTLSATKGGANLSLTTNGSTGNIQKLGAISIDSIDGLLQQVYDSGGIAVQDTATLLLNSSQKRKVSTAYANAYGKYIEQSRNVGGVNVTTLVTDFGTLNVMLDRQMPQDQVAVVSLEQLQAVFLEVPGKGHFFAEPLAKTGASDKVQLYGEVGLAYGNEKAHGKLTGLAV